jgi:hypothetical protein
MFVFLLLLDATLQAPSSPPLPLYPLVTLDVRENVWIEMLFIILSIMFGSVIMFLIYYRIRKTIFSKNIKEAIDKDVNSRLKPQIKKITKPKIGVVITK